MFYCYVYILTILENDNKLIFAQVISDVFEVKIKLK